MAEADFGVAVADEGSVVKRPNSEVVGVPDKEAELLERLDPKADGVAGVDLGVPDNGVVGVPDKGQEVLERQAAEAVDKDLVAVVVESDAIDYSYFHFSTLLDKAYANLASLISSS